MNKDQLYLEHIREAIKSIEEFVGQISFSDFDQDDEKQSAVIRKLEIIGEASRNLSEEFKQQHSEINWPNIISMRNRLIHVYFQVDIDLVWDTITKSIPQLKKVLDETR
jgi:uncharacterized protein with HEPN domain